MQRAEQLTPETGELPAGAPARRLHPAVRIAGVLSAVILLAAGLALAFGDRTPDARGSEAAESRAALKFAPERLSTSDPAVLEKITADEAVFANAARPVSALPIQAAKPLVVPPTNAESYGRSLDCLTAAIYYEASAEAPAGQRSVAQVVLNRVRHPLYPNSVCGVVFQGHERRTGCQFTFTCDGSLTRTPSAGSWNRARAIAREALAGAVWSPVGLATHYHADYVLPYWAGSLVKLAVEGRHIFYRFEGSFGSPPAYRQAYAGQEPRIVGRYANRLLAGIYEEGTIQSGAQELAIAPRERPILDSSGQVLGSPKGTPGAERPPSTAPHVAAAHQSWIIGMDGTKRQSAQAMVEVAPVF